MDRGIFYPAQLPQDTDYLSLAKQAMIGIAAVAEAAIGQDSASSSASGYASVAGLACSALGSGVVSGSAFAVQIGRGFIFSFQNTDPNAYGNLGTDTATSILKTGINLTSTNLGLTNSAPATAGQSINYLISGQFAEVDTNNVAVPFYNSANPASPLVVNENTTRTQRVVFQVTGGTAAATGSQTTPATPSGYVPLYVVTVTNGQTAVAGGNIAVASGAPFIASLVGSAALYLKAANNLSDVASAATALSNLGGALAGVSNREKLFTSSGTWTCPAGITQICVDAVAGGGGSGYQNGSSGGAGGGGGQAVAEAFYTVVPGTAYTVTVGAGGVAATSSTAGTAGGSTAIVGLFTLAGGGFGSGGTGGASGGAGGTAGFGGLSSSPGGNNISVGGAGGGTLFGSGGIPGYLIGPGTSGFGYGSGGAGGVSTTSGSGAPGKVLIRF